MAESRLYALAVARFDMTNLSSQSGNNAETRGTMPIRLGPAPRTTTTNPHMQLDQQPVTPFSAELLEQARRLSDVVLAPSRRAPVRTVGLYLLPEVANGPEEAFMLATEFAHVHPAPDFSMHLTLPEPLRTEAIAAGWAEPHPLAGLPTVSHLIVLLFAPRDAHELAVANALVKASWSYARDGRVESFGRQD